MLCKLWSCVSADKFHPKHILCIENLTNTHITSPEVVVQVAGEQRLVLRRLERPPLARHLVIVVAVGVGKLLHEPLLALDSIKRI